MGLEFHLDRLTRTPNTLNAHRLIRFAGQKGVQDGVVEALFEGYFGNGADIGDDSVLAKLGEEGGLDRDEVAALLSSEDGLKEVAAGDRMARNCRHPGRAELRAAGSCPVLRRRAGRGNGAGLPPRLGHPEEPRGLSLSSPTKLGRCP